MQSDEDVKKRLPRYETVEWLYDGLGGKVIKWTHEQGNTNDDPSVLAYVVGVDGSVVSTAPRPNVPAAFAEWLEEQADVYERTHPTSRVPLVRAQVTAEGEGADRTLSCAAFDEARAAGRPVLLFVGRSARPEDDKKARGEASASRKIEKGSLDSKAVAEAAEGLVLLRLDVGDADHATLAAALGVEKVPALLLFGAEETPDNVVKVGAASLAHRLKKLPRAPEPADGDEGDGSYDGGD